MSLALVVRIRPSGPWRIGPASGERGQSGMILHSDTLYSALSHAMLALGWMEEWLGATAEANGPAVRVSSLFPSQEEHLLAPPPAHLWPPSSGVSRLRASGARLIPVALIRALAFDEPWNEDQWEVDPLSQCLLRRGRRRAPGAPFRMSVRSRAAVDRLSPGNTGLHEAACIEFAEGAGLWCMAVFSGDEAAAVWTPRLNAAFRLLGDSGLGGERHNGWGHFTVERVDSGVAPQLLWGRKSAPNAAAAASETNAATAAPSAAEGDGQDEADAVSPVPAERAAAASTPGWWLLSVFSPAESDAVDWSRGNYRLIERSGRVDSPSSSAGALKKSSRMVAEGSVIVVSGGAAPGGRAWDVAPDGFPHPVWRSGFAVAIELPWRIPS